LRASGAHLVDIGHNDRATGAGVRGIEAWEIEAAITPRTAAFAFAAHPTNVGDLPLVVGVCKAKKIPVIVDAAAQLPPKSNLKRFFELGADLVAFSGGKAIGGPQASGILAGRRHLVGAALAQQLDMDVPPATWSPPELIDLKAMKGIPHHGLGRGFKAGKEEIVGLVAALERFAAADDEAINAALEQRLQRIARELGTACPKNLMSARETGRVPQLHLTVKDPHEMSRRLQAGEPPVHLSERHAAHGVLIVDPQALRPEDDAALIAALRRVL
jgi:L-seryl-tRNA(Ser) seleniumtransferase